VGKRIFGFLLLLCPLLFPVQSTGFDTAASPATFRAATAQRTVELTGFTRPLAKIALISEEEGRCREVDLDVGDVAGKEGTFARLEETFIELELERNRAEQGRALSERSYYAKELERFEELALSEAVAQSALDNAQFRLEQATQQLAALEVQERTLKERLERHVIRAPSGWTIIARNVEPGQWVARGQQVGVAGDFSSLKVPFALTVEELAALKAMGSSIPVRLPDLSARGEAILVTVSPDFDPQTRKVHVELKLRKGDFSFRGGLRTSLVLSLPESGSVFLVPETALLQAYEEHFLLRPEGGRVPVVVLRTEEGMARVASGEIAPGEEFLLVPDTAPGVGRP
jgi:membrane fusion protein, multidrug efflux system